MNGFDINDIIRENIKALAPYSCARNEYEGEASVFLDANENPYDNGVNRYPDPQQRELKTAIAELKGVGVEHIVLGNGSDELIDLLIRSVCVPGRDNIVVFSPGYAMYEVCAAVNDVEVRKVDLTQAFQPDWEQAEKVCGDRTKLLFVCSPNNPVGMVVETADIVRMCSKMKGVVVVDEAYIDFSVFPSIVREVERIPNLAVIQTLSKAWGMAGLRLGIGFVSPQLAVVLNKVKPPYNISVLSQQKALELLAEYAQYRSRLECIIGERERLYREFKALGIFDRVYPSEANFILVTCSRFKELYACLTARGVIVRLRNIPPLIENGLRITVGTESENERLLALLEQWREEGAC